MGLFKHLFWLAPVLMGIFYYISMQQNKDSVALDKDFVEFDRDFAKQKSKKTGDYWEKLSISKQAQLDDLEIKEKEANRKAEIALQKLEKAQLEYTTKKEK